MRPRRQCVAYHIERSIASREGLTQYPCACRMCCGVRVQIFDTIARHHKKNDRDPFLPYPVIVRFLALYLLSNLSLLLFNFQNR